MVGMACPAGASAGQARRPGRGLWPVSPDHSGSVGRAGPRAGFRLDSSQDTSCPGPRGALEGEAGRGLFPRSSLGPLTDPQESPGQVQVPPRQTLFPSALWALGLRSGA